MKLKDISRTATFAWDLTSSASPLLATGAVAGALDESFSNESQLEIWQPDFGNVQGIKLGGQGSGPQGSITVGSRFNRLAWSSSLPQYTRGVLAAGMETGEVNVYDPHKILNAAAAEESRIFSSDRHTGPVRGLDFNPIQKNLLLTGSVNAELYIYDLNNPGSAPVIPGPPSTKLNEITSLQWNTTTARIFAASSSSGFTSVWDVKAGKEIVSLQYGGGAAKGTEAFGGMTGLQLGKRRGMSDATRLITASEDDESPIIMLWDLRNTRAPERILNGHHKGVLSVSWCKQDADLLLSCGKDNRTLCWNPQTGEIIGELPASSDWSFQTAWCPRNPDLLATASFDGHIGIHSLQTTQVSSQQSQDLNDAVTADDVFGALGKQEREDETVNVLSLKQPAKWLRRPVSASFGFGGTLASTSNLPGASGKHQSGVVHLRTIVTEEEIIDLSDTLSQITGDKEKVEEFCERQASRPGAALAWKTLRTIFKAKSRQELLELLGFSKEEVERQVAEAMKKYGVGKLPALNGEMEPTISISQPDLESENGGDDDDTPPASAKSEATPSEPSVASPTSKGAESVKDSESGLFPDDAPGTPAAAAADFFSSMSSSVLRNPLLDHIIPHRQPDVPDSSIAATVGSRPSSVRSEAIQENTFRIYPSGESDIDRLVTQALVVGDFQSAVDICLATERYADALLLAVRGGSDLLASTQKAYFAKRTGKVPFLRIFQSIITEDLIDIVQNADLTEWKVAFAVIATFSKDAEFPGLAEQLGQRLQYRWQMLAGSDSPEAKTSSRTAREDATFCYLAARRLEKLIPIWVDELHEEEEASEKTKYSAHAHALHGFIEKVTVFAVGSGYVDEDLMRPTENVETAEAGARSYKLSALYDRYYEYADLLVNQGLVELAARYVQMTPPDYKGTGTASELDKARDRILRAASEAPSALTAASQIVKPVVATQTAPVPSVPSYVPPTPTQATYSTSAYTAPPAPTTNSFPATSAAYAPSQSLGYQPAPQTYAPADASPYAPSGYQPSSYANGYDPQPQGYGVPTGGMYNATPQHSNNLAPPPRAGSVTGPTTNPSPSPLPAAQRRDMPGWNDAPSLSGPPKRPQSAMKDASKPAPIMSPFPMSESAPLSTPSGPPMSTLSPPPRGQPGVLPPPPKGGPRPPSAQAVAHAAQQQRQPSGPPQIRPPPQVRPPPSGVRAGPPPGTLAGPPPQRVLSPLGPQGRMASPLAQSVRPPPTVGQMSAGPPPGHGQRIAGPPPPGRTSSVVSARPPSVPPAPAAPVTPAKPTYPPGDRTHISSEAKPIYEVLSVEMVRVKGMNVPPQVKKIVEDTERRLNILFDGLNNDTVPKEAVEQMLQISKAMMARDANGALAMHVELMTNATGDVTVWATGVRQLIRLGLA
ncbi:hypothetical protein TREMEDRAFT_28108 [Tremella mesenterica DSM 1558]|uniref:uncharacterized protein n=1 Tax=Tremella mesenterica (strain ATCC 24925 / CBS 8224 / DSM 1558 / NBRC 9311 / NRRL Y-6157 / RJB 2259-6 / UBC 559-6) TaxID=578456 RepID=UPI0003F490F1|nr:uncharacterized protein TREMEDRAFT_28108 [Tremella mesenterica DSM 1558]EIW71064.1 hypothetical protein TREMEDRAFT_28108 [Tremella mesenterica DSM 1558]